MTVLRLPVTADAVGPVTLASVLATLRAGGVVAYPAETLYALAADPANPAAIERLFALKERAAGKPLLLAIADRAALGNWVREVPPAARALIESWPSGLTLVFEAAPQALPALLGGGRTIALRLVRSPVAAALIRAAGGALPATSANRSGDAPTGDPDAVAKALDGLDLLVDGGLLPGPWTPSTLLDVTRTPWRILRAGACGRAALEPFGTIQP